MRLPGWILLAALALAVPAIAQGSADVRAVDTDPAGEPSYHFSPSALTVAPGALILVAGGATEPHTLTHDAPQGARLFDTGSIEKGATVSFAAPNATGDYAFHCLYHGSMTGVLHVSTARATTTSTPQTTGVPAVGALAALAVLALASLMMRRR